LAVQVRTLHQWYNVHPHIVEFLLFSWNPRIFWYWKSEVEKVSERVYDSRTSDWKLCSIHEKMDVDFMCIAGIILNKDCHYIDSGRSSCSKKIAIKCDVCFQPEKFGAGSRGSSCNIVSALSIEFMKIIVYSSKS
jgi:hypothetical protein